MNKPEVKRTLIIGAQGCGKSTLARVLASKTEIPNQLVIEPDEMGDGWIENENFNFQYNLTGLTPREISAPGYKRIVFDETDRDFLRRIHKNIFNHVLIFDDVLFLLTDTVKYAQLSKILGRARQSNNYIFFTIHGLSMVPGPFWGYFTDIILFKTYDEPGRSAYKIPEYKKLFSAYEAVNKDPDPRAFVRIRKK